MSTQTLIHRRAIHILLVSLAVAVTPVASAFAASPHKNVRNSPKTHKPASKSVNAAAWSFPRCTDDRAEYEYIYSGDPCSKAPPATVATIVPAPTTESVVVSHTTGSRGNPSFCNGNAEYDYVYSGCEG